MFHNDRALALTAFFLERAGGRLNDIKLAKLQYIAERRAILRFGAGLANDDGVSLEHGPCLSLTLNLTLQRRPDPLWERHIEFIRYEQGADENTVSLKEPLDWREALSPAAVALLEEIWTEFGAMGKWTIKGWCHDNLGEYFEVGNGKGRPIRLEEIFRAEGDTEAVAAERAAELRYHERFAEMIGNRAADR